MIENWFVSITDFLGASRYAAHSICLTNDPLIMTVYAASDIMIWASYLIIGIALITKRHIIADLSPEALTLYGAFIFSCGMSHFTEVLTLFQGIYRLDVAVTAITAGVSTITAGYTAVALWEARELKG